jgi:hypothetical protein
VLMIICVAYTVGCSPAAPAAPSGPNVAPTRSPSGATARPTSVATASPVPSPMTLGLGEQTLIPGTYSRGSHGYRFTFTVPTAGWIADGDATTWVILQDSAAGATAALFYFGRITEIPKDACQDVRTYPGPTVDDFATQLASVIGFETSAPTDITVDGYRGKRVVIKVPEDVNVEACADGVYHGVAGRTAYGPGDIEDVRVLDLDGDRHVFLTSYQAGVPPELRTELDQIAESLLIDPAGG